MHSYHKTCLQFTMYKIWNIRLFIFNGKQKIETEIYKGRPHGQPVQEIPTSDEVFYLNRHIIIDTSTLHVHEKPTLKRKQNVMKHPKNPFFLSEMNK